ncbi:Hsp20/alpha crystallin family protein [Hahella sp. HN01]|uniref:Hsp20/alpha crystallin family protein n=1 Tax=unclassified Hahella TaxID=2624107 RepID=UPI001C1F0C50|nr:Hsp20/alpha crystallin family protein [Hahella sp. HN01]MBU6955835.1 Hsp20/alpha crystallin family protein [Hahella sp. HN01]
MNLKKWSPWNWLHQEGKTASEVPVSSRQSSNYPMARFRQEMDRLFDDMLHSFKYPELPEFGLGREWAGLLKPNLDISEGKESYSISVELPGVSKEDVKVSLDGQRLTISGEKKHESEEKREDYHCVERSYGSFMRILTLPDNADGERLYANFKNGVLTLKVPKAGEVTVKGREVEIKGD